MEGNEDILQKPRAQCPVGPCGTLKSKRERTDDMFWPWLSCHHFSLCVCSCHALLIGSFCCSEFEAGTGQPCSHSQRPPDSLSLLFSASFPPFTLSLSCTWIFLHGHPWGRKWPPKAIFPLTSHPSDITGWPQSGPLPHNFPRGMLAGPA